MSEALAQDLLTRLEKMEGALGVWRAHWQECADYVKPRKNDIVTRYTTGGEKKHRKVFDGTPENALDILAAGIHSGMTNPDMVWFDLMFPIPDINELLPARAWLEACGVVLHDMLTMSNFDQAIHEFYLDLGLFGTAILWVDDPVTGPPVFTCLPIAECAIAEDQYGRVDTLFRRYKKTVRQLYERYGEDAGEHVLKLREDNELDREVECVQAVYPRQDRDPGKQDKEHKPWANVLLVVEGKHVLEVGGFDRPPFMVCRWAKSGDELWGRGPTMKALADVKMLYTMAKDNVIAGNQRVNPIISAPDNGYLEDIRMVPGNVIRYRAGTQDRVEPLALGDPAFGVDMQERTENKVRAAYLVDVFMQFDEHHPSMTATEVLERRQQKLMVLGPVLGRMRSELLDPLLDILFDMAAKGGELPPPPEDLMREFGGADIKPVYRGPLSLAMRGEEVQNLNRWLGLAGQMAQLTQDPSVLDNVDTDEALRFSHERMGAPAVALRDMKVVMEMRKQRAEAQKAQAEMMQVGQMAEAAGKAAPALAQLAPEAPLEQ